VIHSSYKALEGIAYRVDFLHGNRSIIKLTSCKLMTNHLVYHFG